MGIILPPDIKKRSESLDELIKVQCTDGNWDYDPYNFGLANGLILAKATMENKEAKFLNKPAKWRRDNDN